jgi:hypothetical protein
MGNLSYNLKLQIRPEGNETGPGPINKSPHSESHISIPYDYILYVLLKIIFLLIIKANFK